MCRDDQLSSRARRQPDVLALCPSKLALVSPSPECLLEVPCHWNYRPDHCIYGSNCGSAEEEGIFILHGNRGVYHDLKQPAFRAVYDAIRQVN